MSLLSPHDVQFVCVLWGTKYSPQYVEKLWNGLKRNSSLKASFCCLTDGIHPPSIFPKEIEFILTPNSFPGWWQKINLFDSSLMQRRYVIYFDLDVVILRDLDSIFRLTTEYDFIYAQDTLDKMSSSFMIIDTQSQLASDVLSSFHPRVIETYVDDQDHFGLFLDPSKYKVLGLPPSDHYSYKYYIDHDGWVKRSTNEKYHPEPLENIKMLNFHGVPKPIHLRENPKAWKDSERILPHW